MTDYLRYLLEALEFYKPVAPMLLETMKITGSTQIVDLCSGGGGSILQMQKELSAISGKRIKIILTDLFPNFTSYRYLSKKSSGDISFANMSVNALKVPGELKGVRTIFSGFHHFDKENAKLVLQDAVTNKEAICIFDGGNKNILMAFGAVFIHPVLFVIWTPFIRPFRLRRILFTYLIPVIPLCTMWDGMVSITKLYSPEKMKQLTANIGGNYIWESGRIRSRYGLSIAYLRGYPVESV
jgi:hypothetical protein